jgi:uncharacterized membrane protein YciS (DUF1049 family)
MKRKGDIRILFAGCFCIFGAWLIAVAQPGLAITIVAGLFITGVAVPILLTSSMSIRKEYIMDERLQRHLENKRMYESDSITGRRWHD